MYKAKIFVNYKPSVLDPKAEVIQNTLHNLGQTNVESVVVGKYFEVNLTGNKSDVDAQVEQLCDQMLANVNMETYRYTLEEVDA
ncbi:phosphoribosylformylglycinamidine synthase subunit PurS [Lacticaseibacillus pabuli]|uniref:Phosphoribosylformylglycinamidine synthase subunit PurS n=1 Tax=Lacticaseibacillus pabuli TaxID=3025672 RepID=A0ABY7WWL8_9LACO|nr:phosphoribosylformylglycinamidine synthase subunit PurS [Lacticaseibacillus sp. KACC 23028]WDF82330.1 phosphoribosylformylglycinamidine synthase subunit PurS [Lacticaseibacillus sp. KACC 23028]